MALKNRNLKADTTRVRDDDPAVVALRADLDALDKQAKGTFSLTFADLGAKNLDEARAVIYAWCLSRPNLHTRTDRGNGKSSVSRLRKVAKVATRDGIAVSPVK